MPSRDDVLRLHAELVDMFAAGDDPISPSGVRDLGLLESACGRPHTSFGTSFKYETLYLKSAALFHSLVKNHAFHNGNKRTGLLTLITVLTRNDRRLTNAVSDDTLFDMVLDVTRDAFPPGCSYTHTDEVIISLAKWLRTNTESIQLNCGEMSLANFITQCRAAGVRVKDGKESFVFGSEPGKSLRIAKSSKRLSGSVVGAYMRKLGLSTFTPAEFAAGLPPAQEEINRYRLVLRRLART